MLTKSEWLALLRKKIREILAMKNKPFEYVTVMKKRLTEEGDSLFNGFKTMLNYGMQLSSYSNLTVTRRPELK